MGESSHLNLVNAALAWETSSCQAKKVQSLVTEAIVT